MGQSTSRKPYYGLSNKEIKACISTEIILQNSEDLHLSSNKLESDLEFNRAEDGTPQNSKVLEELIDNQILHKQKRPLLTVFNFKKLVSLFQNKHKPNKIQIFPFVDWSDKKFPILGFSILWLNLSKMSLFFVTKTEDKRTMNCFNNLRSDSIVQFNNQAYLLGLPEVSTLLVSQIRFTNKLWWHTTALADFATDPSNKKKHPANIFRSYKMYLKSLKPRQPISELRKNILLILAKTEGKSSQEIQKIFSGKNLFIL